MSRTSIVFALCSFGIVLSILRLAATPSGATRIDASVAAASAQCHLPYVQVQGQGSAPIGGDITGELQIQQVSIGEPLNDDCSERAITFVIKVSRMDPLNRGRVAPLPNSRWQVNFVVPGAANSTGVDQTLFVSWDTETNPDGAFNYGVGKSPQCSEAPGQPCAATGTVTANGMITIKLNTTGGLALTPAAGPSFIAFLDPGVQLRSVQGKVVTRTSESSGGIEIVGTATPGGGTYDVQGNLSCSDPPIALFSATPATGNTPLTVNFDASASYLPPDGCGTIDSFVFDFGDCSEEVTQSTPIVSHTYSAAGFYNVKVRVATTAGFTSDPFAAQANIRVVGCEVCPDWTISASANPGADVTHLDAVTCASTSDCWAVGSYNTDSSIPQTLIEHWNGSTWAVISAPSPGTSNNELNGIGCSSASACWAVGYSESVRADRTIEENGLIEKWDGTTWSVVPSPATGPYQNFLNSVTCASTSDCWAVGYRYTGTFSYQASLIEHWDGTTWSIVDSPNAGTGQNINVLNAVTCASSSDCWAVGYYNNVEVGHNQTLIQHWDGTAWSIVSSPNAGTSYNWLESVTCTSGSECWAVGSYIGAGNKTLIQRWDGSAWSITSSPNASCIYDSSLRGITCASASACFAVGYYWDNQAGNDTLIERWDGNAWSIVASPNNGSAENNPINNNFLADVACGAATDCVAVGQRSALNSNGKVVTQTLSEHYSVPPVTPTSIVSRKADGSVGTYDIDLRNNPIECRSGGANGDYTIVFNFADALTNVGAASLTSGTGSISNAAIGADPHEYVVDLTGVANAQTITVSLANVNDSVGNSSASVSGTMRVLVGDTTNDGVVNSADIGQTKSQSGQSVSASNFREDVTADGSINSTDISLVKSKSGTALP